MDIIAQYINQITESEQKILNNIPNLNNEDVKNILIQYIETENTLMLAHIFDKLGLTEQPIGCLVDDLKHQVRKKQLASYCSIFYSKYVNK